MPKKDTLNFPTSRIRTTIMPTVYLLTAQTKIIPLSLIVSRTIASLPSIRSFFFASKATAYTSASFDLSAINLPMTLQASLSMSEGNVFLKSFAFVVATDITLLVPLCITFAWMNLLEKKTFS
ncbi:hypothetical protein Hanom_Chr11g01036891 [Helianthus anomalus]